MTGEDEEPQQQRHGGFGFPSGGINIEDLMRNGFGQGFQQHRHGRQGRQQQQRTYSFSFG